MIQTPKTDSSGEQLLGPVVLRVYGRRKNLLLALAAFGGGALLFCTPNLTEYYSNLKDLYLLERIAAGVLTLLGIWSLILFARMLVLRENGFELYRLTGKASVLYHDCTFSLLRTDQPFFTMLQYDRSKVTGRKVVWEYTVRAAGLPKTLKLSNKRFQNLEDKMQAFNARQKISGRAPIVCAQVDDRFVSPRPVSVE